MEMLLVGSGVAIGCILTLGGIGIALVLKVVRLENELIKARMRVAEKLTKGMSKDEFLAYLLRD